MGAPPAAQSGRVQRQARGAGACAEGVGTSSPCSPSRARRPLALEGRRRRRERGAGRGWGGARLAFRWVPEPDTFTWTALDKFSSLKPSCDLHVTPDSPCDIFSSNLERREKGTREDLMPFSSLLDQTSSEQTELLPMNDFHTLKTIALLSSRYWEIPAVESRITCVFILKHSLSVLFIINS